jgi:hypothetical protein
MNHSDIQDWIRAELGAFAQLKGHAVYSGARAWKPGAYYIMGYNPAADETNERLDALSMNADNWSLYLDKCWHCGNPRDEKHRHPLKPHQKRVIEICRLLKVDPREIFATNAIFVESRDASSLVASEELWERCWQVHQRFLHVIQPNWIICLGNAASGSSFSFLKEKLAFTAPILGSDFREGKEFNTTVELDGKHKRIRVLGIPHPSRFPISARIKEKLEAIASSQMAMRP